MYLHNKYTITYYKIINRAKSRTLTGYVEKHHVIPRSLNGNDSPDNLVELTAREHFICHLLLIKMVAGKDKAKMIHASWQMANQENQHQIRTKVNSSTYALLRESFSKAHSQWLKDNRHLIKEKVDKYWTEENRKIHAEKISKATKGKVVAESTKEKHRNKVWSDKAIETRLNNCLKAAQSRKGKTWKLINGKRVYFNK